MLLQILFGVLSESQKYAGEGNAKANAQSVSPDEGRCAEAYGGNFKLRTQECGVQQKQAVDVNVFVHHYGTQQ